MTACVNKNHGRRVAGVVTASLVGALTLGGVSLAAVPTVALAEQGATEQFATGTEFQNGTITGLTLTEDGATTGTAVANGTYQLTANTALPLKVSATGVQVAGSSQVAAFGPNFRLRVYAADEKGEPTGASLSGDKILLPGKYVVVATGLSGSDYAGQTYKGSLEVKAAELPATLNAYESEDNSDADFYFTGKALTVDHMAGTDSTGATVTVTEGVDYTVTYQKDGKDVDALTSAGTYVAKVEGLGRYAGEEATSTIVVKPFELSNDDITVAPFTKSFPTHPARVYDAATNTELDPSLVTLTPYVRTKNGDNTSFSGSTYNVTVQNGHLVAYNGAANTVVVNNTNTVSSDGAYVLDADVNGALEASGNVTYNSFVTDYGNSANPQAVAYKVADEVSFKYGKSALEDSYEIDSTKDDAFDASLITGTYGKSGKVANGDIAVSVKRAEGHVSGKSDTQALADNVYGTYTVTVSAVDDTTFKYGGSKTFTVKVWAGSVDADATLYVYALTSATTDTGKAISSYTKAYDGTALTAAGNFRVDGKDSAGNDINGWNDSDSGSDLKVELQDSEGNVLTHGAKAAGSYKLVVTSAKYKLSGTTELPVTIEKPDLTTLAVGALQSWNVTSTGTSDKYLPLNSKATVSYWTQTSDEAIKNLVLTADAGSLKKQALSDNLDVRVQYNDEGEWKDVGSIESYDADGKLLFGEGQYRVVVTAAANEASNYVLPEGGEAVVEFTVAYAKSFNDVQPTSWYYDWVNKATDNQFMNGDKDGQGNLVGTFRPESPLTRAEAVTVLYNMSGAGSDETDQPGKGDQGYVTGFDDVASSHWASKYIAWAKNAGVVKGYDGTNDFRADALVTRNEFAQMLYNYAKVVAQDKTTGSVDTSKLAFADGVDGWAQTAVAWATSVKDADGNYVISGYPQDNTFKGNNDVLRAEVAKMAVVYQPKGQLL